jgi:hypothetical protein
MSNAQTTQVKKRARRRRPGGSKKLVRPPVKRDPDKPRPGSREDATRKKKARQEIFLKAFATTQTVLAASEISGIPRRTHYEWMMKDPEYVERYKEADADASDRLEHEARVRALQGWEEPVFGSLGPGAGTGVVGHVRKKSDTLLIFLLKGKRPEQFRDRFEVTGKGGGPIAATVQIFKMPDNGRGDGPPPASGGAPEKS